MDTSKAVVVSSTSKIGQKVITSDKSMRVKVKKVPTVKIIDDKKLKIRFSKSKQLQNMKKENNNKIANNKPDTKITKSAQKASKVIISCATPKVGLTNITKRQNLSRKTRTVRSLEDISVQPLGLPPTCRNSMRSSRDNKVIRGSNEGRFMGGSREGRVIRERNEMILKKNNSDPNIRKYDLDGSCEFVRKVSTLRHSMEAAQEVINQGLYNTIVIIIYLV